MSFSRAGTSSVAVISREEIKSAPVNHRQEAFRVFQDRGPGSEKREEKKTMKVVVNTQPDWIFSLR